MTPYQAGYKDARKKFWMFTSCRIPFSRYPEDLAHERYMMGYEQGKLDLANGVKCPMIHTIKTPIIPLPKPRVKRGPKKRSAREIRNLPE